MSWLVFSITGTLLSAMVNFVDKYLVEKHLKDARVMVIYSAIASAFLGTVLFVITGMHVPSVNVLFQLFLAGIFVISATFVYFNVISRDHVSFVVLFFQVLPIFVLVEGFLILGDRLSPSQLLGSILIIASTSALVWTDHSDSSFAWRVSKRSILSMLVFDTLWALSILCIKLASTQVSFVQILTYQHIGVALGGMVIFCFAKPIRSAFITSLRSLPRPVLATIFCNEGILLVAAKTCLDYAYTIGMIGLVSLVDSMQILFVVIIGFLLTRMAPTIFKENTQPRFVFRKIVYILFMIVGVTMIV